MLLYYILLDMVYPIPLSVRDLVLFGRTEDKMELVPFEELEFELPSMILQFMTTCKLIRHKLIK